MERSSGILLPISALPSPCGIGTLGKAAYDFIDFLEKAEQKWWQILPVGPTSYGDSPYQSFSAFAGNPYLIDLDALAEQGLLEFSEITACDWGTDETKVDFGLLYANRMKLLRKAYARFQDEDQTFAKFRAQNDSWLPTYADYMGLKEQNGGKPWYEW